MDTGSPEVVGEPRGRQSLVAAAALTYATNVGAAVLSLVNVLIVARTLGPAGRGDVAFLIAVTTLTANLSAFGIQEANANLGGLESGLRPVLATNSLLFALVFGALAAGVVVLLTTVFPAAGGEVDRIWFLVTVGAIPVPILKVYLQFLVQAEYAFSVTNLAWITGPTTTAVTNGVMAVVGVLSVGSAIIAWICGQAIGTTILVRYVMRHSGFGRPDVKLAWRSLSFGLKTHLGRFMTLGNYRVDQWFVGAISGSRELGFYSVAVAWAEVLYYVPGVLVLVQRPDLVRATREHAAEIASRVFRIALVVSTGVAAVLFICAPVLCTSVFGAEFRNSVDDLRLLSSAAFGIAALELFGSALIAQRRPLLATAPIAAAFVVTITLDVLLIPLHGGLGAAMATSAAWTVGGLAVAIVFRRALPTPWSNLVPRPSDARWLWRKMRRVSQRGGSRAS